MSWATLQFGDEGWPVAGLTRGLFYALGSDAVSTKQQKVFDYHVQRDVMLFQRRAGLAVDGVVGPATWTALAGAKKSGGGSVLDAYAKFLIRRQPKIVPAEARVRNRAVAAHNWILAHRNEIPYAQVRPYPHFNAGAWSADAMRVGTDCSGSVTSCCEFSGALDPNDLGYNGQGYTGTMLDHAHAKNLFISLGAAKRGDMVHYNGHVAQCHEDANGGVPLVFSFGHFPAGLYGATYRSDRIGQVLLEIPG